MGFGRKVGAFLGLVPDDGHAGRDGEYDPAYPADYRSDQYDDFDGAEYAGEYGRDYGSEYAPAGATDRDGGYAPAAHDRAGDRYNARLQSRGGDRDEQGFAETPTHGALAMQPLVAPRREPNTKSAGRPVTIKLSGFADAAVIGEKYRDGQSVIMDMTEMADADARRLVDFAAGLAFAMRGSIDKVTTKVFMLLPSDIDAADISAEQRREFAGAGSR